MSCSLQNYEDAGWREYRHNQKYCFYRSNRRSCLVGKPGHTSVDMSVFSRQQLEQEESFQHIVRFAEYLRDVILFVRLDGRIIKANQAAVMEYGYTREEFQRLKIFNLRSPDNKVMTLAQMARAEADGILFEAVHKKKDGTLFPVEVVSQGMTLDNERILVSIIRSIADRKLAEAKLAHLANYDFLTELPNRKYFSEVYQALQAESQGQVTALVMVDLDNFRVINETFGHVVGDQILVQLCRKLNELPGDDWIIGRLGGDEFALLLKNSSEEQAATVVQKLLKLIQSTEYQVAAEAKISLMASAGIVMLYDTIAYDDALVCADIALNIAKEEGKNRFFVVPFKQDKEAMIADVAMYWKLKNAIAGGLFALELQPIVSLQQEVTHYEALVRLRDVGGKLIYPGEFLAIAEKFNLIAQIDLWVIQTVFRILQKQPHINIFVNLSSLSLNRGEVLQCIESKLNSSGINPARLGFEITESAALRNVERIAHWICRIKRYGCKFALDDFGVGFSSFERLCSLPVDYIKIDGSFIRQLERSGTHYEVVKAINNFSHALSIQTVAEFVENETVVEIIKELQIDYAQGYFFGKPSALSTVLAQR